MTAKFPIDKPMELNEFIRLSEKCIEKDYKEKELNEKLHKLEVDKEREVKDAITAVGELSKDEAKKIAKKRNVLASLIVGLIYFLVPAILYFILVPGGVVTKDHLVSIQGMLPSEISTIFIPSDIVVAVESANIVVLALTYAEYVIPVVLIGIWWIWLMCRSESTLWKWIVGIVLFCGMVTWWGAVSSLILVIVFKANDVYKLQKKIEARPEYKEKIANAVKADKAATEAKKRKNNEDIKKVENELKQLKNAAKDEDLSWLYNYWRDTYKFIDTKIDENYPITVREVPGTGKSVRINLRKIVFPTFYEFDVISKMIKKYLPVEGKAIVAKEGISSPDVYMTAAALGYVQGEAVSGSERDRAIQYEINKQLGI